MCTKTERIRALSTELSGNAISSQGLWSILYPSVIPCSFKKFSQLSRQSWNLSEKITSPVPLSISNALKLNKPVPVPISMTVSPAWILAFVSTQSRTAFSQFTVCCCISGVKNENLVSNNHCVQFLHISLFIGFILLRLLFLLNTMDRGLFFRWKWS